MEAVPALVVACEICLEVVQKGHKNYRIARQIDLAWAGKAINGCHPVVWVDLVCTY